MATKSLQAAVARAGEPQPVSVQALAAKYHVPEPVSLRALMSEVGPDQRIFKTDHLNAGDVQGFAELAVLSNGWYSFHIFLHDDGEVFGDNFKIELTFGGGSHSVHWKGHINADATIDKWAEARDPAIAANWDQIKSHGFTWNLHSEWEIGDSEWGDVAAYVLGIGGLVIAAVVGGDKCNWTDDGKGNVTVTCRDE